MRGDTMKRVFCNKCEYFSEIQGGVFPVAYRCDHPSNVRIEATLSWLKVTVLKRKYLQKPSELNANNNCSNYKEE